MRAARDRLKLTQEAVAERMNVSIHTYRRWDQGKNRPARLEEMQLLALILKTPVEVIWPAERDPHVAEALRLEQQRAASPPGEPAEQQPSAGAASPDAAGSDEIKVRRLEKSPVGLPGEAERERSARTAPEPGSGGDDRRPADVSGGLPPWPDERDEEPPSERPPADAGLGSPSRATPAQGSQEPTKGAPPVERVAADDGAVTLRSARLASRQRATRAVVALGAALLIGGAGMVAAGALGDRAADADPSSEAVPEAVAKRDRERVQMRARDVAAMRAAADRGDYDAAIALARQVGDETAASGYRESAARLLVGRADKAARRGDLSLARSRLRAAKDRYGTAPGSTAVQARARRIERQRNERAQRQRADARRVAAALAAQRAAANSVGSSEPSGSSTPTPSTSNAPQSPSSSTSDSSSSSSKSSGGTKDSNETVDPGLF